MKSNKGGYGLIYQNIMHTDKLSRDSKVIYAYLCSYANTAGVCYPTRERIKADLQMNDKTFKKYMDPLIELGIVEVEKTTTTRGINGRNIYHICHAIKYDTAHRDASQQDASQQVASQQDASRRVVQTVIDYNSNTINNNILNSTTDNTAEIYTSSTTSTLSNNIHTISTNTCISNIPTVDQVENECSRYGFEIEPEKFVEHCKSRNIKDWKFELYTYSAAAAGRNRNRRKEMKE